jgi:hypothetical protein
MNALLLMVVIYNVLIIIFLNHPNIMQIVEIELLIWLNILGKYLKIVIIIKLDLIEKKNLFNITK